MSEYTADELKAMVMKVVNTYNRQNDSHTSSSSNFSANALETIYNYGPQNKLCQNLYLKPMVIYLMIIAVARVPS